MNYTAEFSKIRDELQKGDNKKDWRAAFNALDYSLLGQKVSKNVKKIYFSIYLQQCWNSCSLSSAELRGLLSSFHTNLGRSVQKKR